MNGENFKNFLNKNIDIQGIDIFIKTSLENTDEEENLFLLKSLTNLNPSEFKVIKEKISDTFNNLKSKKMRCYDLHKSRDEIFYFNINDLRNMSDFNDLVNDIFSDRDGFISCSEYKDNIKMIVIKVITNPKHQILFFVKYDYNSFAKKNIWGKFRGDEFNISNEKVIVLNFSPTAILFDDELLIVNNYINSLFDFSIFYNDFIKQNQAKIENIFHITDETFKTKDQKFYITRGIMTGGLDKYNSFESEKKADILNKFKKVYKEKYDKEINIEFKENKININNYSSKEKEEIIKFLTNKSALTSLTGELTTALD